MKVIISKGEKNIKLITFHYFFNYSGLWTRNI
jgi:hypothetical protein